MKFTRPSLAIALGALCVCAACLSPAAAAPIRWKSATIDYSAEGKDIKDVLRDIAASQGLAARIAPDVAGTVSGKFHLPPRRLLDTLSSSFGFVWYYDGQVLDITSSSSLQSTLVKLDSAGTAMLRQTLDQMRIADDRFPIVYDAAQGTAIVGGPPRYVQLVTGIADRIDSNAARRGGTQVRVFPLKHAWSQDRSVQVDGQKVVLPGVVAVLNGIYHPKAADGKHNASVRPVSNVARNSPVNDVNGQAGNSPYSNALMPPVPGNGITSGLTAQPSPALLAAYGEQPGQPHGNDAPPAEPPAGDYALPVIVADQRTNSVVVRDAAERMSDYDTLIERLDVRPELIEIEAHIIEIDDDALRQLGIDWTAHNSHVDIQTGTGTNTQNTFNGGPVTQNFGNTTLAGGVLSAASPAGLSMAAVLGDAGRYLMARVSALSQSNLAKIDASPKVVTLNNIEAVMDNKTQFFVPVQGYTSGELYSISTGVSLRVLPMVVEENGQTHIKLDVAIQDGELTSQTVSNLPVIDSSNITTQAFIDEGQALLVAGYRKDTDSNGVTGVPGLSKIPLIGALFRTENRQKSHMERLFLLSPRILTQ
jgi:type III secretion protein C